MALPLRQRERRSAATTRTTPTPRPQLAVVPGRRRFAWFAVTLSIMIGGVMVGALALHTRISERQLEIDQLERSVRQAQTDFDVLRAERAELRSPTRLADRAGALGMVPGAESEFLDVDPMTYAVLIASTGEVPVAEAIGAGANTRLEPLDQFRLVKSVSSEVP
jgi:cell division protein FtsL